LGESTILEASKITSIFSRLENLEFWIEASNKAKPALSEHWKKIIKTDPEVSQYRNELNTVASWKKNYLNLYKDLEKVFTSKISQGFSTHKFEVMPIIEASFLSESIQ
jgi:hypothetical protein